MRHAELQRGHRPKNSDCSTDLLAQAQKESGGSKSRAGAYFAASHPEPPLAVIGLYKKITEYLAIE
jgi:hypothetical protein